MNAAELHAHLISLGASVSAEGGRLRINIARGALPDELQKKIADHRAELLELVSGATAAAPFGLVNIKRDDALPLSFFQERIWILHRLDPNNTAYNMVVLWPAGNDYQADVLANAIRDVIRRQEILRSVFCEDNGVAYVKILSPDRTRIDIRQFAADLEKEKQYETIHDAMERAKHTPFDLAKEPPVRFTVYRAASGESAILVAAHHIILDAWSLILLRQEIFSTCEALASGTSPQTLPVPRLQYVDFAAWQRNLRDQRRTDLELAWWERQLAGIPQLCVFPPDKVSANRNEGSTYLFSWDSEFTRSIHRLAYQEGATVYMTLLAACSAVLQAHTGLNDIVLGSPMGVRERSEFESMIGPFVNLLVIRLTLDDDPTFAQLLRLARNTLLDAFEHRDVPFELLVERLKPVRMLNHPPLFQVAVVQHNAAKEPGEAIHSGGAIHDFTWFVREVDGRLESAIEYRSDLFSDEMIKRIASHLEILLRAAVADPRRNVKQISLTTPQERQRVLVEFNATKTGVDHATVVAQFERQVSVSPGRCAIRFGNEELTYAELNQRANRLAHHLNSLGIGPGKSVGLCLERSLDLVVGLLGILKAGAAYVPLDPAFPVERVRFMLRDSGVALLITTADIVAGMELPSEIRLLDIAKERDVIADHDENSPVLAARSDDLAYIIYTSGSLGQPKGVEIPHRALSNFLAAMRIKPGLNADDIVAAVTTISFDIAGLELYLPLLVGACIELIPRETANDGAALARHLAKSRATIMQATPVTWRQLIDAGWQGCSGFRALCGGESLPRDLADTLLKRVHELWNLYGPTETTIWSTIERVTPGSEPVAIGKPIANTQVYIVGPTGEPLGIGMPGEIWIGGAGVAAGYHARPELTAERFVPDRFSSNSEGRLYRTGDLGKWESNSQLYHLGRIDHQVKLRGVRIELGEIEAVLRRHPAVRDAVVVARQARAQSGDLSLVAYVVYQLGEELTATEVRRYLRRYLPDTMVPSVVVALDEIPVTPNGKTDHKALPDPFKNVSRSAKYEKPTPGSEAKLADIWQRLLKVDRVGAGDNFFELGGHSLLAIGVAAAVEKETGWRMDPRAMFFQDLREIALAMTRAVSRPVEAE